ncbi:hypothetical protein RUND412_004490 [Rhizina undulata]
MNVPESTLDPPTLHNAGYFLSLALQSLALNHDCQPRRINRTVIHVRRVLDYEMDEKRYLQHRTNKYSDSREDVFKTTYTYPISNIYNFASQMLELLPLHKALPMQIENWENIQNNAQAWGKYEGRYPCKNDPIGFGLAEIVECQMFLEYAHKIHPGDTLSGESVKQAALKAGGSMIKQELHTAQLLSHAIGVQKIDSDLRAKGLPASQSWSRKMSKNDTVLTVGLEWWLEKEGYPKLDDKKQIYLRARGEVLINWYRLAKKRVKVPPAPPGIRPEVVRVVRKFFDLAPYLIRMHSEVPPAASTQESFIAMDDDTFQREEISMEDPVLVEYPYDSDEEMAD